MPKSARGYAACSWLSYGWPVPENGLVLEMTREEFEELVAEALDRIPPELTRLMDNVAVFVEDEPPADDPELLGLYEGTPLTERGEWYAGVLPDRITPACTPSATAEHGGAHGDELARAGCGSVRGVGGLIRETGVLAGIAS